MIGWHNILSYTVKMLFLKGGFVNLLFQNYRSLGPSPAQAIGIGLSESRTQEFVLLKHSRWFLWILKFESYKVKTISIYLSLYLCLDIPFGFHRVIQFVTPTITLWNTREENQVGLAQIHPCHVVVVWLRIKQFVYSSEVWLPHLKTQVTISTS